MGIALGVDIGGTNTVFGLCDETGNILYESSLSTKKFKKPEELVKAIYSDLNERGSIHSILGIGIGAPNANY